jgi:hypothetical protein
MKAVVAAEHTKANAVRQLQALGYRVILKKPRRGMNKDQTPPPVSDHPPGHQRLYSPAAVASAFPRNPSGRQRKARSVQCVPHYRLYPFRLVCTHRIARQQDVSGY